jgi:hypothetical protein
MGGPEENQLDPNHVTVEDGRATYRKRHGGLGAYRGPLLGIATFWALYLLKQLAGLDVIALLHPNHDRYAHNTGTSVWVLLSLAIVATIAGLIIGRMNSAKAHTLMSKGVEATGTVVAQSGIRSRGMTPTTIAYTVDGKEIRFRKDMPSGSYDVGDTVRILYDLEHPENRDII